jgi:hypothetical protein
MSNKRKTRPAARPPDDTEHAFRDALREGCPWCHSRRVVSRFHDDVWDYGLRCEPDCRTHTEPQLAHRIAAEAARRAGVVVGEKLSYRAADDASGVIGVVLGQGK